jgi:PEP-CTERM motif
MKTLAYAVALFLIVAVSASAEPIQLYNTGVSGPNNDQGLNSTIIGTGGANDPAYTTVSNPAGPVGLPSLVVTDQGAYYRPGNSQYINDTGSGNNAEAPGDYDYQTTFSLNHVLVNTATISGTAYTDDTLANILVNGVSTGISGGNFNNGGGLAFTIPAGFSGFQSGVNTLDFIAFNCCTGGGANPTAFDVTLLRGTATIPEPASIVLFGLGAIGLFIAARRRRSA